MTGSRNMNGFGPSTATASSRTCDASVHGVSSSRIKRQRAMAASARRSAHVAGQSGADGVVVRAGDLVHAQHVREDRVVTQVDVDVEARGRRFRRRFWRWGRFRRRVLKRLQGGLRHHQLDHDWARRRRVQRPGLKSDDHGDGDANEMEPRCAAKGDHPTSGASVRARRINRDRSPKRAVTHMVRCASIGSVGGHAGPFCSGRVGGGKRSARRRSCHIFHGNRER